MPRFFIFSVFLFILCSLQEAHATSTLKPINHTRPETIKHRFAPPAGYTRAPVAPDTFASYLQNLPLKPEGSLVHLFDGSLKPNQQLHAAVIDIDVGHRDLQQCADAVIRLRAEYLWQQKRYQDIHFHFTNGFEADYSRWRNGERIQVGREVTWVSTAAPNTSYRSFRKYLTTVFIYAGTLSLAQELQPKAVEQLSIGDVWIQGGSPGHAVLVVDIAKNKVTSETVFLMAQSYMPAQDIHILKNLNDSQISPWYSVNQLIRQGQKLKTPEWNFETSDLRRF